MRPPPRLSNCYTPLPRPKDDVALSARHNKEQVLSQRSKEGAANHKNCRSPHSLRHLLLESNVISSASGSALVELGSTKVLCTVTGPVTASCPAVPPSLQLNMDAGTLYVDVKYTPATGYPQDKIETVGNIDPNNNNQQQPSGKLHSFLLQRESDLSARVLSALQAAVPLAPYPKCAIVLQLTVLQDDGSVLAACVTAASLALIQAGIEVYDVVTACSVAVVVLPTTDGEKNGNSVVVSLLADPTLEEMNAADIVVTIAILPNWKEVTVWEQSGAAAGLSQSTTNEAVNLCRDGCRTMHKFMREHLLEQAGSTTKTTESFEAMDETTQ